MLLKTRVKLASIKQQTANSREIVESIQKIIDNEREKDNTPEINEKLTELEMHIGKHRVLIAENEAMIAKLEQPFLKFWKWM
jgi:DNA primase large subunit